MINVPEKVPFVYSKRLELGHSFESRIVAWLKNNLGLYCFPSGQGFLLPEAISILTRLNDQTSLFLRFFPDLICPIPSVGTVLIDGKTCREGTPNYSFCLDSYYVHLDMVRKLGHRIIYFFPLAHPDKEPRAIPVQYPEELITRQVTSHNARKKSNGSVTAYSLVKKLSVPRAIDLFKKLTGGVQA